jgi:hypothetical protein
LGELGALSTTLRSAASGDSALGTAGERCVDCLHFRNDPATIERAFPGLSAMGSAGADVRACDGLCELHGVYLSFSDRCAQFQRAVQTDKYS